MLFGWFRSLPWKRCATAVAPTAVRRLNAVAPPAPTKVPLATSPATRDLFDSISANELRHMLHRLEVNWSVYHNKMPRLSTTFAIDADLALEIDAWVQDSVTIEEHAAASEWV